MIKILASDLYLPDQTLNISEYLISKNCNLEHAEKTINATGINQVHVCDVSTMHEYFSKIYSQHRERLRQLADGIDVILSVSQSQIMTIPNLSCYIHGLLGSKQNVNCLELVDGCNGFIKAVSLLDKVLEPGHTALIVSGEISSCLMREAHYSSRILFGDGLCITKVEKSSNMRRISVVFTDGGKGLYIKGGCKLTFEMDGFEIFRFVSSDVTRSVRKHLVQSEDINPDYWCLHQASKLVVNQLAKSLALPEQSAPFFNTGSIGNLGSGSIPSWLALSADSLKDNCILRCVGFGSGLSWGLVDLEVNNTNELAQSCVSL